MIPLFFLKNTSQGNRLGTFLISGQLFVCLRKSSSNDGRRSPSSRRTTAVSSTTATLRSTQPRHRVGQPRRLHRHRLAAPFTSCQGSLGKMSSGNATTEEVHLASQLSAGRFILAQLSPPMRSHTLFSVTLPALSIRPFAGE